MPKYRFLTTLGVGILSFCAASVAPCRPVVAAESRAGAPLTALLSVQWDTTGSAHIGSVALKSIEWTQPMPALPDGLSSALAHAAEGQTKRRAPTKRHRLAWLAAVAADGRVHWSEFHFDAPSGAADEHESGDVVDPWDTGGTLLRVPAFGPGTRWYLFVPSGTALGRPATGWQLWMTAEATR